MTLRRRSFDKKGDSSFIWGKQFTHVIQSSLQYRTRTATTGTNSTRHKQLSFCSIKARTTTIKLTPSHSHRKHALKIIIIIIIEAITLIKFPHRRRGSATQNAQDRMSTRAQLFLPGQGSYSSVVATAVASWQLAFCGVNLTRHFFKGGQSARKKSGPTGRRNDGAGYPQVAECFVVEPSIIVACMYSTYMYLR